MTASEASNSDTSNAAVATASVLPLPLAEFAYSAQTETGLRLNGTLEAPSGAAAVHILEAMRLHVTQVTPVDRQRTPKRLRDDAFSRFNQTLAQLVQGGLPVEKGGRLAATDLRRGRVARAVARISAELQQGVPLKQAFEKHQRLFPPIYGRLLSAAVGSGNIPGVLLNLGRHVESQKRLAAILWRSTARPLVTLCALLVVAGFIGGAVVPQFRDTFADYHLKLPLLTQAVLWFGCAAPILVMIGISIIALLIVGWAISRIGGVARLATDRLLLPLPFVGPVLRYNLIARWADAVRIGVLAGLELPAAMQLAGDATASPILRIDGAQLAAALTTKSPLSGAAARLLPATVAATLEFSATQHQLPDTLQSLCDLYERQAELRLERIPAIITPVLFMLIAVLVGFIICGLLLPLIAYIQGLSNGVKF